MKVLSILLKIVETLIVCVWGVFFGMLFPICIMIFGSEIIPADIAGETWLMAVWLITSLVGYVIPAALIFGKHHRAAAVLSLAGFIGVLVVDSGFAQLYRNTAESSGPDGIYLPLIFATILDIFICAVEERDTIKKFFEKRSEEKEAPAPSIFGDGDNR